MNRNEFPRIYAQLFFVLILFLLGGSIAFAWDINDSPVWVRNIGDSSEPGEFNGLDGIDVDSDGYIYMLQNERAGEFKSWTLMEILSVK